MTRRYNHRLVVLLLTVGVCVCRCIAQTCSDDPSEIKKALLTTGDPQLVLRSAAVGGRAFVPLLRTLSKPGQSRWTVPGAAQVALARLGDENALDELRAEIRKNPYAAIEKLAVIRTEVSLSVLMEYVIEHENDSSRVKDAGEYVYDPLDPAIRGMIEMLEDPPYRIANTGQASGWHKWWQETKPPHIISIYESITDPTSRCLARLAEWGYVDALYQLYLRMGKDSIPLLRRFAQLGDKSYPTLSLKTVGGAAQTLLAREGDQIQFQRIVKELQDALYADAIAKLQYISGPESFETLLRSLSLTTFMPNVARDTNGAYLAAEGKKLRIAVMAALSNMVTSPPLPPHAPPTPENIQKWVAWWEINKTKNVLKSSQG